MKTVNWRMLFNYSLAFFAFGGMNDVIFHTLYIHIGSLRYNYVNLLIQCRRIIKHLFPLILPKKILSKSTIGLFLKQLTKMTKQELKITFFSKRRINAVELNSLYILSFLFSLHLMYATVDITWWQILLLLVFYHWAPS